MGTDWVKHVNIDEIVWRESERDGKWEPVECWDNLMWRVVSKSLKAKKLKSVKKPVSPTILQYLCECLRMDTRWSLQDSLWLHHFHFVSFHDQSSDCPTKNCACSGSRMRWSWHCFTWALLSAATPLLSQLKRISTQTMTLLLNQLEDYSPFCQGKPG